MTKYAKDATTGVVHVMDPSGCGEFTFCSVEAMDLLEEPGLDEDGVAVEAGVIFATIDERGPSNCRSCRDAVAQMRAALCGVKWARAMAKGQSA